MKHIVIKFGGTSVSTIQNIRTICSIVKKEKEQNPIVIVSALSGVTDLLLSLMQSTKSDQQKAISEIKKRHINLAYAYWGEIPSDVGAYINKCVEQIRKLIKSGNTQNSHKDKLISYGEVMSSYIIATALKTSGIKAEQVLATSLIVTNENFGSAEFIPNLTKRKTRKALIPILKKGTVPVLTGFIGSTKNGETATLGRGGSDYTASIIGWAVGASEIQIWTDVDGIFTSDPKFIKDARVLPEISYKEASELAAFGAKVLHPRTIRPAVSAGIPVRVLNTFNPEAAGTVIKNKTVEKNRAVAIAAKRKITLVNLYSTDMLLSRGFLARIFSIFSKYNISIDLVSVSEVSVSVSLDNDENLKEAISELSSFSSASVTRQLGMVSIIGEGIVNIKNILKNVFSVLDNANIKIRMISLGATDINISLVLQSSDIDRCVSILHRKVIKERKL